MSLPRNTPDDSTRDAASGDGQSDSKARMRLAAAAAARGVGTRDELYAAAVELVTALKNANEPPEQMLLHVKEILIESGLRPTYARLNDPSTHSGAEVAVYRDVIAWSIRHYYADGRESDGRETQEPKAN